MNLASMNDSPPFPINDSPTFPLANVKIIIIMKCNLFKKIKIIIMKESKKVNNVPYKKKGQECEFVREIVSQFFNYSF